MTGTKKCANFGGKWVRPPLVFMLLGIFMLYGNAGSTDYQILCCLKIEKGLQYLVFLRFLF